MSEIHRSFNYLEHSSRRTIFGRKCQQQWLALWLLEKYLTYEQPDCIVELGTGRGLLATYFSTYAFLEGIPFVTIDLAEPEDEKIVELIKKHKGKFIKGNITDPAHVEKLTGILNKSEKGLLYVDGADPKYNDINLYAPLLKPGITIAAHDARLPARQRKPHWLFRLKRVDWEHVEKLEPYYTMGCDFDTRTLYTRTT